MGTKHLFLLALCLTGCAPIAGTHYAWLVAFIAFFWSSSALAGAQMRPKPCTANELTHTWCNEYGQITKRCYPKSSRINFAYRPYVACGYDRCVPGNDPTFCPERQPRVNPNKTKENCGSYAWQKACIKNTITEACIPRPPTNYGGPPMNPPYKTCETILGERCAIHADPLKCFPTQHELGDKSCEGDYAFRTVCIDTRQIKICALTTDANVTARAEFKSCPENRCAAPGQTCP